MKKLIAIPLTLVAISACAPKITKPEQNAAFWNRTNMSSALYMRGPKAQHQLHKDIASCVSETKELSRLGTIRNANPPAGVEMNVGLADNWQSPKGDGPLYTEFQDFNDFEGCMNFKGWERTNYVRHDQIQKSRTNYRTTILGETARGTVSSPSHQANNNTASRNYNN